MKNTKLASFFRLIWLKIQSKRKNFSWKALAAQIADAYQSRREKMKNGWNVLKTNLKDARQSRREKRKAWWSNLKTRTNSAYQSRREKMKNGWNVLKTNLKDARQSRRRKMKRGWDDLKTKIKTAYRSRLTKIKDGWPKFKKSPIPYALLALVLLFLGLRNIDYGTRTTVFNEEQIEESQNENTHTNVDSEREGRREPVEQIGLVNGSEPTTAYGLSHYSEKHVTPGEIVKYVHKPGSISVRFNSDENPIIWVADSQGNKLANALDDTDDYDVSYFHTETSRITYYLIEKASIIGVGMNTH